MPRRGEYSEGLRAYLPAIRLGPSEIRAARETQPALHVVVTGRGAPKELIDAADLVTDMTEIKHPFQAGIRAQRGIEF